MKFIRILLRIILVLVLLLLVCWFVGTRGIDYTPYFETAYYQTTIADLEEQSAALLLHKGAISVGMAKVNITPTPENEWPGTTPLPLAGYGKREGQPAEGVHDSLFVKVLIIQVANETMAIVGTDMLIVPPQLVELTQQRLSQNELLPPRERIFYSATHTHSSIGGWSSHYVGEAFAGAPNDQVINWLADRFALAIKLAVQDITPGSLSFGNFPAPDLVYNRLVKELGTEQSTFSYLCAQQQEGQKAVVGIFDAHATTLNDDNMNFSADYPAFWYQKMESAGIDLALFCAGSVGSHGPEASGKGFEKAKIIGEELGDSLLVHLEQVHWQDSTELAVFSVPLALPPFQVRLTDHRHLAPFLAQQLFPEIGDPVVQTARIGRFIWSTTPADFSGELALLHEDRLHSKGYTSTITSFNGAYIGYVVPQKYYYHDSYESKVMSWFGPNMSPYLDEILRRMTDMLIDLP